MGSLYNKNPYSQPWLKQTIDRKGVGSFSTYLFKAMTIFFYSFDHQSLTELKINSVAAAFSLNWYLKSHVSSSIYFIAYNSLFDQMNL